MSIQETALLIFTALTLIGTIVALLNRNRLMIFVNAHRSLAYNAICLLFGVFLAAATSNDVPSEVSGVMFIYTMLTFGVAFMILLTGFINLLQQKDTLKSVISSYYPAFETLLSCFTLIGLSVIVFSALLHGESLSYVIDKYQQLSSGAFLPILVVFVAVVLWFKAFALIRYAWFKLVLRKTDKEIQGIEELEEKKRLERKRD